MDDLPFTPVPDDYAAYAAEFAALAEQVQAVRPDEREQAHKRLNGLYRVWLGAAKQIQVTSLDEAARRQGLEDLGRSYFTWFKGCLGFFTYYGRSDLQGRFTAEFEGAEGTPKIKQFLESGWKHHEYFDWMVDYGQSFQQPLTRQIDLLMAVGGAESHDPEELRTEP